MGSTFDPLGDLESAYRSGAWGWRMGQKIGRWFKANREHTRALELYGPEVADAVKAAVLAGRDPKPIYSWAERMKAEQAQREEQLQTPPPLHGSATWARPDELTRFLKGRDGFDTPSSLLLGAYLEDGRADPTGFVHWDGDGHLLTVAPTRSGKAVAVIIPNLLRYRGSAVVLDPKGELYAATSAWRAANVGPVYRLAPFDAGDNTATAAYPRHGFNPLTRIRSQADARAMAALMFPRDPKSAEFFAEDAVAFLTGLILFVLDEAPPERRTLAAVRQITSLPIPKFRSTVERMAKSSLTTVAEAANNVLGKSGDRGLPTLRDTLHSKLALWSDEAILSVIKRHDFDFEGLKDRPATVYVQVPLDLIQPYAPFLKVLLKSALDAMLRNPAMPKVPVLFVLDEFLALGPFPEFRDAIRTHAGAGVRLWFFLQDVGTLEEHYPRASWRPFLNTAVKLFFGVNDPFTADLVGRYLGQATVAYRTTSSGSNVSAQLGSLDHDGSAGLNLSASEGIAFVGRPLLTPDEVMALLSDWKGDGWRFGIVHLPGPRPFKVCLVPYSKSPVCQSRIGAHVPT